MENFETIREALSHWHLPGTSYDPKKKTIRKKLFYNEEAESLSRRSNHFEICSIGDLFDERRFPGFLNYSLSSFPSTSFSGRAGLAPKIIVNANTNNANSPEEAEQSDEITKSRCIHQYLPECEASTSKTHNMMPWRPEYNSSRQIYTRKYQDGVQLLPDRKTKNGDF